MKKTKGPKSRDTVPLSMINNFKDLSTIQPAVLANALSSKTRLRDFLFVFLTETKFAETYFYL
jgi:hypothetical protein